MPHSLYLQQPFLNINHQYQTDKNYILVVKD